MANTQKLGWIGMGRMGFSMAERLIKAGHDVTIWNRTRAKAEPLAGKGGKVVDKPVDLGGVDVLFSIVSAGKDLKEVLFGPNGAATGDKIPPIIVDCSTIAVSDSAEVRAKLKERGSDFVASPVSGNAKVIKAGKLSAVISGREAVCKAVTPLVEVFAPKGVSYVGDGELARVCKIAHNVMLGVVIENLIEITLLANKMGVPRQAFLAFMNNSVMGSMFTGYKAPALVNLDWTTTFTPGAAAQGSRSRARAWPRARRADADDGGHARVAAGPHRRRHAAPRRRGLFAEGLRHPDGDHGADVRHAAHQREQERAHGAGVKPHRKRCGTVSPPPTRAASGGEGSGVGGSS